MKNYRSKQVNFRVKVVSIILLISWCPILNGFSQTEDLNALIAKLGAKSRDIRNSAIEELVKIGSPAVEPLIKSLKKKDNNAQVSAAIALGRIKDPRVVKPLMKSLEKTDSDWVKRTIAEALGEIGDPAAAASLIRFLRNCGGSRNAEVITRALGKIGNPQAILPILYSMSEWNADHHRVAVEEVLLKFGEQAVESLIPVLNSDSYTKRADATRILGLLGDPRAVEQISNLLNDNNATVVGSAIVALGNIGDPRAIEPLAQLSDKLGTWSTRLKIPYSLAKIGTKRAVEVLINKWNSISSFDKEDKEAYEKSLERIENQEGLEYMFSLLMDKEFSQKNRIAMFLGKTNNPLAVDPLIKFLNEEKSSAAAEALGMLGDSRAVEPLISFLMETKSTYAVHALRTLGDTRAVEPLSEVMRDSKDNWLKRIIIVVLAEMKDTRAVDPLIEEGLNAYENAYEDLQGEVVQALRKISSESVKAFNEKLKKVRPEIQKNTALKGRLLSRETQSPLSNILVFLCEKAGSDEWRLSSDLVTFTDTNGYFSFKNILPGKYTLAYNKSKKTIDFSIRATELGKKTSRESIQQGSFSSGRLMEGTITHSYSFLDFDITLEFQKGNVVEFIIIGRKTNEVDFEIN